jgi:histidyl-tRNA synthetase
LDRLSILANFNYSKNSVLVVSLNEDKQAIKIAGMLRERGNSVSIYYGKPSKAMEYANSWNIQQVIFVGAEEVKKKKFKVKDMISGKEKILTLEKRIKKNVIVQRK